LQSQSKEYDRQLLRRILADFLIGAYAAVHRYRLLTLDQRLYRAAFPKREIAPL
jgi:predicted nucleic acid-binding protein